MKDTNNEFEVICICRRQGSSYSEMLLLYARSWLRHPPIHQGSNINELLFRLSFLGKDAGLLAFDRWNCCEENSVSFYLKREHGFYLLCWWFKKDAWRRLIKRYEVDLYWLNG